MSELLSFWWIFSHDLTDLSLSCIIIIITPPHPPQKKRKVFLSYLHHLSDPEIYWEHAIIFGGRSYGRFKTPQNLHHLLHTPKLNEKNTKMGIVTWGHPD